MSRLLNSIALPIVCTGLLVATCLGGCGEKPPRLAGRVAGRTAAVVNGRAISEHEVRLMEEMLRRRASGGGEAADSAAGGGVASSALDRLIDREVVLQVAEKRGLHADSTRVGEEFRRLMAARGAGDTLWRNLTEGDLRTYLADDIIFNTFLQRAVIDSIPVTDDDLRGWMAAHPEQFEVPESGHFRQILIPLDTETAAENARRAAYAQAQGILGRTRKPGASFPDLARQFSRDPNSAPKGGDLGTLTRGATVAAFDSAAFSLGPGDVSGVVTTPYGYHIIQCESRTPATTRTLDSVRPQVAALVRQSRAREAVRARIEEFRKRARIELKGM